MRKTRVRSVVLALCVLGLALSAAGVASVRHARHQPAAKKAAAHPVVEMKTSLGDIQVELDATKAPVTTKNFLRYVHERFFDGTIFHRVIPGFMVQGGGFTRDLVEKKTHAPIVDEASNGLKNLRGTIAMARTSDPNSATAQFFINVVDNGFLDYAQTNPGYAVFGQVVAGMDVADKIAAVPTSTQGGMQNVPVKPVVIESIRRIK